MPDVLFFFTGADAQAMILDNAFVSVEEIQKVYPNYASNIRASSMEFMREFDNKHYAVPVKGFWEAMFCNVDLFEQYDLDLPTTWATFNTAIEVFVENEVTPIAVSMTEVPHYWIEHLILSAGGVAHHKLNPYTYVPQTWVDGMQHMVDLYNLGAFGPDALTISNSDAVAGFTNKQSAMLIEGSWSLGSISQTDNTVVLPIPGSKQVAINNSTFTRTDTNVDIISGFSSGFYISRAAWEDPDKQQAVVELVMHLTSNDAIASLCANGGAPAADVQVSGSPSALDDSVVALQSNANEAVMPVDSRLNTDAWTYLVTIIPDMLQEKVSPQEVITNVSTLNKW